MCFTSVLASRSFHAFYPHWSWHYICFSPWFSAPSPPFSIFLSSRGCVTNQSTGNQAVCLLCDKTASSGGVGGGGGQRRKRRKRYAGKIVTLDFTGSCRELVAKGLESINVGLSLWVRVPCECKNRCAKAGTRPSYNSSIALDFTFLCCCEINFSDAPLHPLPQPHGL